MGTQDYLRGLKKDIHAKYYKNDHDVDNAYSNPSTSASLPDEAEMFQQILVLVLSEELVFLFMNRTTDGHWEFVSSHHSISSARLVDPGLHMAISPDGGYLALACSEHLLIVYQLAPMEELRRQYTEGLPIQPIRSGRARGVMGVINKLDFLHPSSENTSHVVLLIMTVQSEVVRLATYEWDNPESLHDALKKERSGHRLDAAAGLPLLVVPLTVRCQFLLITEHSMAICSDVLSGPPVFAPFELGYRPDSDWHHGTHIPMWTAWTRPSREGTYHADTDLIYLAREDGWVNCLEIRGDSGIETSIYMGPLECNIDSGFTSLSIRYGELLVVGGGYCPGSTWSVVARKVPKRIGSLPNWSPTTDLVLISDTSRHSKPDHKKLSKQSSLTEKTQNYILAPDRVFACSGRGLSGAIVELRYGIQAKIGLDLSYPSPIKRCWVVPSFDSESEAGFLMLLALPQSSALLHISHDLSEVVERVQNEVKFDLLSTTLAVHISKDTVIQITTAEATIVSPTSCYQHSIGDMIEDLRDPSATVTDAVIMNTILALSVYSHSAFKIMVFIFDENRFVKKHVLDVQGEVTALSVNTLSAGICVLAGLSQRSSGSATLKIFPIEPSQSTEQAPDSAQRGNTSASGPPSLLSGLFAALTPIDLKLEAGEDLETMAANAVTSIICHDDDKMLVGMRDGAVLTIRPTDDDQTGEVFKIDRTNYFGVSPSHVFKGMMFNTCSSTLVCNDAGLAIMKESDGNYSFGCFEEISRVWLTDANEPHLQSPTVNSVATLRDIPEYGDSTWAMVAGSHILIAQLEPHPTPVPRYMPTGGTPFGILYSERLEALVTVIVKKGIPSLHFFDPITGADLSHPVTKASEHDEEQRVDVDYITYLGNPDVKVVSLLEWSYKDKGKAYEWFAILAKSGENQGRLLVVSAEQETVVTSSGISRRIRFWTQFHRKFRDRSPRCGATGAGGLFIGFEKTVECHLIQDKRFITALKYDLPSPPTCLEVVDPYLNVLTTHHSLVVLNHNCEAALKSGRMILTSTDGITRNGLHSIDMGLFTNIEEPQHFVLTSSLTCSAHGLWSSGVTTTISELKTVFTADLVKSIRKFVHGYTRPRWTKSTSRHGRLSRLDRGGVLGLAMDGSLTEFVILDEDLWRLLRYIQGLAMTSKDIYPIARDYSNIDVIEQDLDSAVPTNMHVDGDILQRCLEKKMLERIVSTPQKLIQLQALLRALSPGDETGPLISNGTLAAFERTYDVLEYYLAPAL
ncbi:hypothetical protein F5X97DRAFT_290412 [Nemania serpens]|nr:hypothetical protein F5X97DRAFT_290412 [Nemania serpens]